MASIAPPVEHESGSLEKVETLDSSQTMSARATTCVVRPAKSVEEARELWWPLMKILEWDRWHADAQTHYHSAGPESWLLMIPASADEANETKPQGCIVPFGYANHVGWVGFFCITAPYRGHGYGARLFQECMILLKQRGVEIVGLDAVLEQVPTYARRGFVQTAKIKLMIKHVFGNSIESKDDEKAKQKLEEQDQLIPIRDVPLPLLTKLDLHYTGFDRPALWTEDALFSRADVTGYGIVGPASASAPGSAEEAELKGFVLVRRCQHGYRIGPLYAASVTYASCLLQAATDPAVLIDSNNNEYRLIAEVYGQNPDAVAVFEGLGWKWAECDYHRMWLDGIVPRQQQQGGTAEKGMFAIFDAAEG